MQKSQLLGRVFVAFSLVVFGVQHFIYGGFVATLVPAVQALSESPIDVLRGES